MKYIFRIATIFSALTIINGTLFTKNEPEVAPSTATVEQSQKENDILTTISENARILVQQMQKNTRNVPEHKKALAALDKALNNKTFKELPEDIQSPIKNDTSIIKEESKAFFAMRKPLKKYNTKRAENALADLASIIKKQTEATTETVVAQAQNQVSTAIATTQDVTQEGQLIIEQTRQQLAAGLITPVEAAKIIGEQSYKIGAAERALKKTTEQAKKDVEQSDAQSGYLSRLTTSIYNAGSRIIAPFKAGYGYSEEEKAIARAIITELETQLKMTIDRYKIAYAQATTPQERINLQQAFELTTRALHDEIYQQKIITGEAMSTQRKLFWGTVAVAGAVAAGYLGAQYFMPTQETPIVPTATTPTEQNALVTEQPAEQPTVVLPPVEVGTPPIEQQQASEIAPTMPVTPPSEPGEETFEQNEEPGQEPGAGASTLAIEEPKNIPVENQEPEVFTPFAPVVVPEPTEQKQQFTEREIQEEEKRQETLRNERQRQEALREELQAAEHDWTQGPEPDISAEKTTEEKPHSDVSTESDEEYNQWEPTDVTTWRLKKEREQREQEEAEAHAAYGKRLREETDAAIAAKRAAEEAADEVAQLEQDSAEAQAQVDAKEQDIVEQEEKIQSNTKQQEQLEQVLADVESKVVVDEQDKIEQNEQIESIIEQEDQLEQDLSDAQAQIDADKQEIVNLEEEIQSNTEQQEQLEQNVFEGESKEAGTELGEAVGPMEAVVGPMEPEYREKEAVTEPGEVVVEEPAGEVAEEAGETVTEPETPSSSRDWTNAAIIGGTALGGIGAAYANSGDANQNSSPKDNDEENVNHP